MDSAYVVTVKNYHDNIFILLLHVCNTFKNDFNTTKKKDAWREKTMSSQAIIGTGKLFHTCKYPSWILQVDLNICFLQQKKRQMEKKK